MSIFFVLIPFTVGIVFFLVSLLFWFFGDKEAMEFSLIMLERIAIPVLFAALVILTIILIQKGQL
jgi:hypothetical protein